MAALCSTFSGRLWVVASLLFPTAVREDCYFSIPLATVPYHIHPNTYEAAVHHDFCLHFSDG
jgi:hypothetical protein